MSKRKRGYSRETHYTEWVKQGCSLLTITTIFLGCFVGTGWVYTQNTTSYDTGVIVGKSITPPHSETIGKNTYHYDEKFMVHVRLERGGFRQVEVSLQQYYALEVGDQINYYITRNRWVGQVMGEGVSQR